MNGQASTLARVSSQLSHAGEYVLAMALIVGIALNFINVLGRYIFGFSLVGVDEIEIYILIWSAFLGAVLVYRRGDHLRMDVLLNACPRPVRQAEAVLETCTLVVVASFVAYQSFLYVDRIYALGAVSDIARIPTWFPHSAVFVSFALIALIAVARGLQALRRTLASDYEPRS